MSRLAFAVALLTVFASQLRAANLIANPGFESGVGVAWTVTSNVLRESLIQENWASWNHGQWHYSSGREAAFVGVGLGGESGRVSQRVTVSPGAAYLARVRFRAADNVSVHTWGDLHDAQKAALCVREYDSAGNPIGEEREVCAAETMDWETLELCFTTSGSTARVEIAGFAYMVEGFYKTLGRAIFDDFALVGPTPPEVTIGVARSRPAGTSVFLRGKTVTASFDGFFYIEESDRSAGIRVAGAAPVGRKVDVIGVVSTTDGERVVANADISIGPECPLPRQLGVSVRAASDLISAGLLVATWGAVDSCDEASRGFTISDGGKTIKVSLTDGKAPLLGTRVRVSGVLGAEMADGRAVPVLRATAANIVKGIDFELPSILWGSSTRPDGTLRFWDPEPPISLGSNLLTVAYRPRRPDGTLWNGVGMTPPAMLADTLVNAQPELRVCHDHGIEVIGYADCILYYADMLQHDGIDCSGLAARDAAGNPVTCSSWGAPAYVSCVNNPQWVELQKQVTVLTAQAGFDHLMMDIYPLAITPGYHCHCIHCQLGWIRESQARFGAPQPMPPADLDFTKPVDRAFFEWRLGLYTDFVKTLQAQVRTTHPKFRVLMNQCTDSLDFVRQALDGALEVGTTELWHMTLGDESSLYMYRQMEGINGSRLIGVINDPNQAQPDYRYKVCIAEAYAGGGSIYAAAPGPGIGQLSPIYYDFIRANQEWYAGAESQAAVGVLYSWKDHAYMHKMTQGPTVSYGQGTGEYRIAAALLARAGVPYDCVVVDRGLSQESLAKYRVIVAPNLKLLDDLDAALLEQYVRCGGRLLCVGALGTMRQMGDSFVNRGHSVLTTWTGMPAQALSWNVPLGRGRVSYVSQAYTGSSESARIPTTDYLSACAYLGLNSQISLSAASTVEATIRGKGDRVTIHLIRLAPPESVADRSVHLEYEIPAGRAVQSVDVASPDFTAPSDWVCSLAENRLRVDIGRVDSYSLVRVELRRQ